MKIISAIILSLSVYTLHAQDNKHGLVVGSSGAGKTGTNETLTWTIGQPIIKNFSNGSASLSSGNQQTDIKLLITAVEDKNATGLTIHAYPNPTQNQITITFDTPLKATSTYDLISSEGKCITSNTVLTNNQLVNVSSLPNGIYVLNVYVNNSIQSFKIIKQ